MNDIRTMTDRQLKDNLEKPTNQQKKHFRQRQSVKSPVLNCPCGNKINLKYNAKEVHCYKCQKFHILWDKSAKVKWKRQQHKISKETNTPANCATITYKSKRRNKEALKKMANLVVSIQEVR